MTEFFLFCLATIGLTNILVHGRIMDVIGLRPFAAMWLKKINSDGVLSCYECMGFWSGLLCGAIFFSSWSWWCIPVILASGWAGSVLSQTYTELMYILNAGIKFDLEDKNDK